MYWCDLIINLILQLTSARQYCRIISKRIHSYLDTTTYSTRFYMTQLLGIGGVAIYFTAHHHHHTNAKSIFFLYISRNYGGFWLHTAAHLNFFAVALIIIFCPCSLCLLVVLLRVRYRVHGNWKVIHQIPFDAAQLAREAQTHNFETKKVVKRRNTPEKWVVVQWMICVSLHSVE